MSVHSDKAKQSMEKCIEALKNNFGRVRTGRANPHALDHIKVDYYGQPTPISQLAAIKVPEASMLLVEPWDKTALKSIEKAIETSDLSQCQPRSAVVSLLKSALRLLRKLA